MADEQRGRAVFALNVHPQIRHRCRHAPGQRQDLFMMHRGHSSRVKTAASSGAVLCIARPRTTRNTAGAVTQTTMTKMAQRVGGLLR